MSPRKRSPALAPQIRLSTFILADHADAVNGKLNVIGGGWNQISASQFPAKHGHLSVALGIRVPWTATNEKHSLDLAVLDEDGNSIVPAKIGAEFEVGRPPGFRPGDDNLVVAVFNIDGLTFAKPGQFSFVAHVDGVELDRLRFSVVAVQAPPKTA